MCQAGIKTLKFKKDCSWILECNVIDSIFVKISEILKYIGFHASRATSFEFNSENKLSYLFICNSSKAKITDCFCIQNLKTYTKVLKI